MYSTFTCHWMEGLLLSSQQTMHMPIFSKLFICKWTAVLPNVCYLTSSFLYHCTPTQLMSSPQSVVTCNISIHASCLCVQLDAHRCSPMYSMCPYSTVASCVVAVNVPSVEGSLEGLAPVIHQAYAICGKCVCVYVHAHEHARMHVHVV